MSLEDVGKYTKMGSLIIAVYYNPSGSGHIDVIGASFGPTSKTFGNNNLISIGNSEYGLAGSWREKGNIASSFGASHLPKFYLYTGFTPRGASPYEPAYGPYYMSSVTVEATNSLRPATVLPPTLLEIP